MPLMVLRDGPPQPDDVEGVVRSLMSTVEPLTLAADRRINPGRRILNTRYERASVDVGSTTEAVEWFDTHARTVLGCIQIAHDSGRWNTSWTLAEGLWSYLHVKKDWALWLSAYEIGLEAAQHCKDPAQARMLSGLGTPCMWQGRLDEAERLHARAKALWVSAGHTFGHASSLEALGVIALNRNLPLSARSLFQEARGLHGGMRRERGVVLMERRLGEARPKNSAWSRVGHAVKRGKDSRIGTAQPPEGIEEGIQMQEQHDEELLVSVEDIAAVRSRAEQPSDGGSTGRGDTNDNAIH